MTTTRARLAGLFTLFLLAMTFDAGASSPGRPIRAQAVAFDRALVQSAAAELVAKRVATVDLRLFDDLVLRVEITGMERTQSGGTALTGRVAGLWPSSVVIVDNDGVMSVDIATPLGNYALEGSQAAGFIASQVDPRPPLPLHAAHEDEHDKPATKPGATAKAVRERPVVAGTQADDGSLIDVMVLYTAGAVSTLGDTAAVNARIDAEIAKVNLIYANSGVTQRVRLVHKGPIGVADNTNILEVFSLTLGTPMLPEQRSSVARQLNILRDAYRADLVSVWGLWNTCGAGSLAFLEDPSETVRSLTAVDVRCTGGGSIVFAHELGHNQGLRHDVFVQGAPTATTITPEGSTLPELIGYQHGFSDTVNRFYSIMAYESCTARFGYGCQQAGLFSNRSRTFDNTSFFVSASPTATFGDATSDEVRFLNDTRETIAAYRESSDVPAGGVIAFVDTHFGDVSEHHGTLDIVVGRHGGTGAVSIAYSTVNGTGVGGAIAGTDYTTTSGTLTWADGDFTTRTISVPITPNAVVDGFRRFTVQLTAPTGGAAAGGHLGNGGTAYVTLVDDEVDPWPPGGTMPAGFSGEPFVITDDEGYRSSHSFASPSRFLGGTVFGSYTGDFNEGTVTMRVKHTRESGTTGIFRMVRDNQALVALVQNPADWTLVSFPVTAGTHTLTFQYEEYGTYDASKVNRFYLDDFTLPAPGTPRAATALTAVVKDAALEIGFTPGHANGSPITSFTATCMPGSISANGTASPILVTGLANNTAYTCSVTATNALGTGPASGSVTATPVVGTQFTSANAATFNALSAGTFTVTTTGAPATLSVTTGTLPTGVTLSPAGVLSGTPASGTVGTYAVTITASPAGMTQAFTLTVDKSAQAISWAPLGEVPFETPYTLDGSGGGSGNPVVFTAISTLQCATSGPNGATLTAIIRGYCSVTASQAGNADYHAAPSALRYIYFIQTRALVVTGPASLEYGAEVAFSSQHGTIGSPVYFTSLTPSICTTSGTVFDVNGGRYLNGHLVMPLALGLCRIRAAVNAHTNWAAAEVTLELVVNKRSQFITMTTATTLAPGQTILAVTGSGGSGNPVTLSSSTPGTCSVSGLNVTGVYAGLCQVIANQAGNAFFEAADTTGKTLTVVVPMTLTTHFHTVTLLDGRVFAFDATQAVIFDPSSGTWTVAAAPPTSHASGQAVLLADGRVFAAGGFTTAAHGQTSVFDPVAGTWSAGASMGHARVLHTLTRLADGQVLAAGGALGANLASTRDSTELFNPSANTWTFGPTLSEARAHHTATLFADGRVLFVGGQRGSPYAESATAQWYDPVANAMSAASGLPRARYGHTATLLPDGALLVVGGIGVAAFPGSVLRDPVTGTFGAESSNPGRISHTATLLADGSVLAAGGRMGPNPEATASTVIYVRAIDGWTPGPTLLQGRASHGAARLPDDRVLLFSEGTSEILSFSLQLLATQLPQPVVSIPYGPHPLATLNATGAVTYAVTGGALPTGLTLSPAGVVTGTPTQAGTFTATVTATDAASATDTADFGFTVVAPLWSVTPSRTSGGTLSPITPVQVAHGGTTPLYPNASVGFSTQVGGTCPGTYVPGMFTAGPITSHCTVHVTYTQVDFPPDPPTITEVVGGSLSLSVLFTPGANNGQPITGYGVTCTSNQGTTPVVNGTSSPITVTNLLANFQYRCRVTATNAMGTSAPSAQSDPVVANPPTTALTISRGGAGSAGGRVTSAAAGIDCPGTCTATILRNAYFTFEATVQAGSIFSGWLGRPCEGGRNDLPTCTTYFTGASATLATNFLAAGATTLPGIPNTVSGEEAPGAILVYFQGGSAGASPITHFTATCTPSGGGTPVSATGTYSPITVGGLNAGTSYTCNVFATSALGNGNSSSSTVAITVPTPGHLLSVSVAGSGQGTVSDSGWISCNPYCTGAYDVGTTVTLTATPEVGSAFSHWSNGTGAAAPCSGSTIDTCTVTLAGATSVTANFLSTTSLVLTVTKNGTGSGGVTSSPAGIDCGATCSATFSPAQVVTLTATPTAGDTFAGWTGPCSGTATCVVTMDAAKTVIATFSAPVDATPPDTTITGNPASITNSTSAAFTFTSTEPGTFECKLDAAAFTACGSPVSLTSLAAGSHTFQVRAIDAASNVDATPASFTWTIDTAVPTVAFTQKPPITAANQASYVVGGTCSESGRTVNVQIASVAASAACASGTFTTTAVNVSALPQGAVSLTATTTDAAGNSGSVTDSTTKDTAAPALTIGALDIVNFANRSSFAFAGGCESGGGVVSFTFSATATLNGTAPCVAAGYAATGLNLAALSDGTVNLSVTQADGVGNSTTTTGSMLKDTVSPLLTIDVPTPVGPYNYTTYSVTGTCSEAGRAVSLNVGGVAANALCGTPSAGLYQASGLNLSALTDGPVALSASHVDAAGNAGTANAATTKDTAILTPRLANISTRGQVMTGGDVMIAGFIIGGTTPKTVAVTVAGPSLIPAGIPNALANPTLVLIRSSDGVVVGNNDDWQQAANAAAIQTAGFAPAHANEPAVMMTLAPGAYTAIVQGTGGQTGVGLVGVYEVDHPEVPLINISTRGQVMTGADVMIAGFIIQGIDTQTVVVTVAGPSLIPAGIPNALANPNITIVRASDGAVIATNDNWQTQTNPADAAAIQSAGFAPAHVLEPAVKLTLPAGAYTAIVQGTGGTGVGLVGVYRVP